jgi:hypothetical protein
VAVPVVGRLGTTASVEGLAEWSSDHHCQGKEGLASEGLQILDTAGVPVVGKKNPLEHFK